MNRLNTELKAEAVKCGLCQQWQNGWLRSKSEQELIDMYKRGIDFCIVNNYPSDDFIKENFDHFLLKSNGVFVDCDDLFLPNADSGVYVVKGTSEGSMIFRSNAAATVYVCGSSKLHFHADGYSKLFVHAYDSTSIDVAQLDAADVFLYIHSDNVVITGSDKAKVRK